jgi:tetratricopeptide (TPR) repeat protein
VPVTDPSRSFSVAVRHLFRHLDDGRRLLRNPIAIALIGNHQGDSKPLDTHAIATIRSRLLRAGEDCSADDLAAGYPERARRQAVVLSAACGRVPAGSVARTLGLSLPQLYRDRRAICERVVRNVLMRENRIGARATDPVTIALQRVSTLCERGFAATAMAECERLLRQAQSDRAKSQTLLTMGDTALKLGDGPSAKEAARAARVFATAHSPNEPDHAFDVRARLLDYRLAMHEGLKAEACLTMHRLIRNLDGAHEDTFDGNGLQIELLLEFSRLSAHQGKLDAANDAVSRAAAIASRNPDVFTGRHVEVAVMGAAFGREGKSDPRARLLRMQEALHSAYSLGSAIGALFASVSLAHQSLALGDASQANSHIDNAVEIARSMEGRQSLLFAVASVSVASLQLRFASRVTGLIFELENRALPKSDLWTNLKLSHGALLLRSGKAGEAMDSLRLALEGTRVLGLTRLQIMTLRLFAESAQVAGRKNDARDAIHAALRLAESSHDSRELQLTYRAASKIFDGSRIARHAIRTSPEIQNV